MRHRALLAAVGLLLTVNAAVLAGAAWNRSGEPEAILTLTERELARGISPTWRESSGVELRFEYRHGLPFHGRSAPGPDLPDEAELAALGFDPRLPDDIEEAAREVRRQSSRRGWAVLEMDGPAAAAWSRAEIEDWRRYGSRLFVVDAGPDPAALRARHPDRRQSAVVPARISVALRVGDPPVGEASHRTRSRRCERPRCRMVVGSIELLVPTVDVPARLKPALAAIPRLPPRFEAPGPPPAYEATLAFGRRGESWIQAIRPLPLPP